MTLDRAKNAPKRLTPKQRVLRRYPKAAMNTAGYIQVPTGRNEAVVIGRSWADAAAKL